jgi:hypothetical protein
MSKTNFDLFLEEQLKDPDTSQQQISRLESPSYEGHSLSMLRRVANILGATVRVTLAPNGESGPMILSEAKIPYRTGRQGKK